MSDKIEKKRRGCTNIIFEMTDPSNVEPALHIYPKVPDAQFVIGGQYFARYRKRSLQGGKA